MLVTAVAGGALVSALLIPAASRAATARQPLTVIVTTGTAGQLITPDGETVAAVAATIRQVAARAADDERPVVILDAGRTLAPYAESRFDGGATVLQVLGAAGCQAFAPNEIDLTVGAEQLLELATDSPFAILRPFTSDALDGLRDRVVIEAGPVSVAVTSLLADDELDELSSIGIGTAQPHDLQTLVDADPEALVITVAHSAAAGRALVDRAFAWQLLEAPGGADLLIEPDMGYNMVVTSQHRDGPVALVGLHQGNGAPWLVAEISLELEPLSGGGWQVADTELTIHPVGASIEVDASIEAAVQAAFAHFREQRGQALPPSAPSDRAQLEVFVLETMREAAAAEVAVLNRGGLRPVHPSHFAGDRLTQETVSRILSLDQWLVTTELTGEQLAALAAESNARISEATHRTTKPKDSLVFAGLSSDGTTVNKRPLHEDDLYRVVTTTYLAGGGDDFTILAEATTVPLRAANGDQLELRDDVVIPRLSHADTGFPNLNRRPLWRYGIDRFLLSLNGVSTARPTSYDSVSDSRVTADDSSSILGDLQLRADLEMPSWVWENRLRTRYGVLDSEGTDERELDDDIRLNSTLALTSWTALWNADPFVGLTVDSELRRNSRGSEKLPRQLEQTVSAGVGWTRDHWSMIRLGAVARRYGNQDRPDQLGLNFELHYELEADSPRPGLWSRLYLEHLQDDDRQVERLDAEVRLLIPVHDRLLLTPGLTYYLYDDSSLNGTARYLRYSLGLTFQWRSKKQMR